MPCLCQNILKQLNRRLHHITSNCFTIKYSVAYILRNATFQRSLLRTLKARIRKTKNNSQRVAEMKHQEKTKPVWLGTRAGLHTKGQSPWKTFLKGPTTRPKPSRRVVPAGPPCPLTCHREEARKDALRHLRPQDDCRFICGGEALGSWRPSTGSHKPPCTTLRVSSGSRCLGAAAQVSSSTEPPVPHI